MSHTTTKRALIVEGGALRSVFSAGLLDAFLAHQFNPFDLYLGVSAGACNLLGFLSTNSRALSAGNNAAVMPRDNTLDFYTAVAGDRRFLNYRRFLLGGDLINLSWLIDTLFLRLSDSLQTLDLNSTALVIATTEVSSGLPRFTRATATNLRDTLAATMSLPLLHRDFPLLDGCAQTDGGVAANIPIAEALRRGASQVMMVRSRPRDYVKTDTLAHRWIRHRLRSHSALVATMRRRCELHDEAVAQLRAPPPGVQIVDVCPPPEFAAGRFARSRQQLSHGYEAGLEAADAAMAAWAQLPAAGD